MKAVPANRFAAFALLAVVGCAVDLATKTWIFDKLGMPDPGPRNRKVIWLWEDVFGFQTSLNEGALFGIGQGQVLLFATLSVVAALGIVYWLFIAGAARDWLLTVSLGCVTGGIFGNLYDRLGLWQATLSNGRTLTGVHEVRDWILWTYQGARWPNFNIADSLLVCGAALLVWHALFCGKAVDEDKKESGKP